MARISTLFITLATLILFVTYALSYPKFRPFLESLETKPRLATRDRAPGAKCPAPLLSTVAQNTDQDETNQYRICCPGVTPDGMKILDEVLCCKRVTSAQDPEGCTEAAGNIVYPASVKDCDKGWEKQELKKIKFCKKKKVAESSSTEV